MSAHGPGTGRRVHGRPVAFFAPEAAMLTDRVWPRYPDSGLARHGGPMARCYGLTKENLAACLSLLPLDGADVLTVAASGDQLLNALTLGAKHVDTFDHNILAAAFQELKVAALCQLSRKQFLSVFQRPSPSSPRSALTYPVYRILRRRLSYGARTLLDGAYHWCGCRGYLLRESEVFNNQHDDTHLSVLRNIYLRSDGHFERTRSALMGIAPTFFHCTIACLQPRRFYDVILLSNIAEYAHRLYSRSHNSFQVFCQNALMHVVSFCRPGGVIALYVCNLPAATTRDQPRVEVRDPGVRRRVLRNAGLRFVEFPIDDVGSGRSDTLVVLYRT